MAASQQQGIQPSPRANRSANEFVQRVLSPAFLGFWGVVACSVLIVEGFLCFTACIFNIRAYILSFYYILFGIFAIAAELKVEAIEKKIRMIHSNIGRGI